MDELEGLRPGQIIGKILGRWLVWYMAGVFGTLGVLTVLTLTGFRS